MPTINQKGAVPLIMIIAVIGLLVFVAISSVGPFKDKALSALYPKPQSQAASEEKLEKTVLESEYKSNEVLVKFNWESTKKIKEQIKKNADKNVNLKDVKLDINGLDEVVKQQNIVSAKTLLSKNSEKEETDIPSFDEPEIGKWFILTMGGEERKIKENSKEFKKLDETVASLKKVSDIEAVEPIGVVAVTYTPNDSYLNNLWYLSKIAAFNAWDISKGIPQTKIAVLDTGIESTHPDLLNKVVNQIDYTGSPNGPKDYHGHGTHVSGTIAATMDNSQGIVGISPNVSLMNGKVLADYGSGYWDWIINGIIWATNNGSSVISMSLGGYAPTCPQVAQDAINYAWSKGVVVVVAAANANAPVTDYTPANCMNVVSVAALDQNDVKAGFSNYGPTVTIAAPGVNIYSSYIGSGYAMMSGTSMATPMVSAVAGLIKSVNPALTNTAIVKALADSADKIPQTGTLWKYGKLNAANALAQPGVKPVVQTIPLYRIYNQSTTLRLWTTDPVEIDYLKARGYINEGLAFNVFKKDQKYYAPGMVPVYRMYLQNKGLRIYTSTDAERTFLQSRGWINEGSVFFVYKQPTANMKPVYRLKQIADPDIRFLTTNVAEVDFLKVRGWMMEQIDFYVP